MAKRMLAIVAVITVGCVIAIFAGSGEDTGVNFQSPKLETSTADVPQLINYQGVLTDGGGNPLDATVSMTFTIYDAQSGGTALWTETHGSVTVVGGLFTVLLGSVTSIPSTLFDAPDRWLGLAVNGDPEMERERMASVPYSFKCGSGDGGDDVYLNKIGPDTMSGNSSEPILTVVNRDDGHEAAYFDGSVKIGRNESGEVAVTLDVTNTDGGNGIKVKSSGEGGHAAVQVDCWTNFGTAVHGNATGEQSYGVWGKGVICGVYGQASSSIGTGVWGHNTPNSTTGYLGTEHYGVYGVHGDNNNIGYLGSSTCGVYGRSWYNWAGYFDGTTYINGNLGIGEDSPTHPLHMGSGAHCTAGGVWTDASSIRYKENVTDLPLAEALEALECLNPVTFNYKVDKEEKYVGFIAEEVPELVATKDREGLSPMDIVGVLTKVVQEQQRTIEELREDIAELKKK